MEPTEIRVALNTRGLELGNSAEEEHLQRFAKELGISFDEYHRQLYSEFNGFASHDNRSLIFWWPLERIMENKDLSLQIDGTTYFAIGDLLLDSDFLMCCLQNASSRIFLLYEERELAPATSGFFERFISGDFDFI